MTTISYNMTSNYRKEWDCIDAVRELVQNCLDNKQNPSTYTLSVDGMVTIHTPEYVLPLSALALGASEKTSDSIGGFGEGMKLALMILARENLDCTMFNGSDYIIPKFVYNPTLEADVFCLEVKEHLTDEGEVIDNEGLSFTFWLPLDRIVELKQKVDVFSDYPMPLPNKVDILEHRPGEIFINGLFVCKLSRFRYGYNFAPSLISLGCDRQVANEYGVALHTSKAWCERVSTLSHEVLNMLTEDCLDVTYFDSSCTEEQAKAITRAFVERFGNVTIKSMGSKLGYGMSVGGSLYSTMKQSGYICVANSWEEKNAPHAILRDVLTQQKKHMRRSAIRAFTELLEQSKKWRA